MDVVRHQCLIYEGSPSKHLRTIAGIMIRALKANKRCLYLNSPTMVAGMRSYLSAGGVDVAMEVQKSSLVLSSSRSHLRDNVFDGDKMLEKLAEAVDHALCDGYDGLFASGDMTWEIGPDRDLNKLLAYECGLEDLFHRQPALQGVCQYHVETLPPNVVRGA